MKAFVITLKGHDYSEAKARDCINSAETIIDVETFDAVDKDHALDVMNHHGLKWTWANNNTSPAVCPISGLRQHPYGNLKPKIGCSMSHYLLWMKCAESGKPLLILEHDALFLRPIPDVDFDGICQINDPRGATPFGDKWAASMAARGAGVFPKTKVMPAGKPDGLAGNSAYLLRPTAAVELINVYKKYGVWPNDATMCVQLFPYLQELYPFVTRVRQTMSTSSC